MYWFYLIDEIYLHLVNTFIYYNSSESDYWKYFITVLKHKRIDVFILIKQQYCNLKPLNWFRHLCVT